MTHTDNAASFAAAIEEALATGTVDIVIPQDNGPDTGSDNARAFAAAVEVALAADALDLDPLHDDEGAEDVDDFLAMLTDPDAVSAAVREWKEGRP